MYVYIYSDALGIGAEEEQEDDDFVTDLYMHIIPLEPAPDPVSYPVVQVEGLRILEDGLVDLVYAYDRC